MSDQPARSESDLQFVRRLLMVLAIGTAAAAAWLMADILLLLFGAVLFAVLLLSIAELFGRLGIPHGWSVFAALVVLIGPIVLMLVEFGGQLMGQLDFIARQIETAVESLERFLSTDTIRKAIGGSSLGALISRVFAWGATIFGALAGLLLVLAAGAYIAADPQLYRRGLMRFVPSRWQSRIDVTLDDCAGALRRWLVAQGIAMVLVGLLTGTGMWLIGLPSPLALGLVAGITEFVPYIGPIIGAIPALLVAYTQGPETLLWALGVVVVVQQLESLVIMPLLVGSADLLPPATAIFAVIAIGVLLGPLGLLFGYPLALAISISIRQIYVGELLARPVEKTV